MRSRGGRVGWAALVALVVTLALVAVSAAQSSLRAATPPTAGPKLPVSPKSGSPTTTFRVTFKAPEPTGITNGLDRTVMFTVTGPGGPKGCLNGANLTLAVAQANTPMTEALMPAAHQKWCPGAFTGNIQEEGRPVCAAGTPCPQFIELTPLGHFSFIVRQKRTSRHH